uniref:hypothetical protein n=1 Tax=Gemmata sp. TaxID=1914242 RepID=UPI003F6EBDE8
GAAAAEVVRAAVVGAVAAAVRGGRVRFRVAGRGDPWGDGDTVLDDGDDGTGTTCRPTCASSGSATPA